eukprot:GFUD01001618.1.p1 GENE.GFUD01001618.1~~GFUD01001618.1.p1  ORF type:complete len:237 (-),score=55.15 GFUD01001618.1:135-845(-)
MKKVRSEEGCLCFSSRCLVLTTGCFSVMLSLLPVIPCLFVLVRGQAWDLARLSVREWLQENHGDKKVNDVIATCFDWLDRNYQVVLAGIIITAVLHLLFSLLLVLGTMLYKRLLFIPWMVSDMIIIIIMVIIFTCWTFLSFFVGLLVAIIFPFVAGLLLGFLIFLWRQVQFMFVLLGETDRDILALRKQQAEYKPVPGQGADQCSGRRQLASISESSDQGEQYQGEHYKHIMCNSR